MTGDSGDCVDLTQQRMLTYYLKEQVHKGKAAD
jgi:hypothetical protein